MIPVTLHDAAKDPRVTRLALRCLVLLHRECTYFDYRPVKTQWLARVLDNHKPHVSTALACLRELGYIDRRFEVASGSHTYRLSHPHEFPTVTPDVTDRAA